MDSQWQKWAPHSKLAPQRALRSPCEAPHFSLELAKASASTCIEALHDDGAQIVIEHRHPSCSVPVRADSTPICNAGTHCVSTTREKDAVAAEVFLLKAPSCSLDSEAPSLEELGLTLEGQFEATTDFPRTC